MCDCDCVCAPFLFLIVLDYGVHSYFQFERFSLDLHYFGLNF